MVHMDSIATVKDGDGSLRKSSFEPTVSGISNPLSARRIILQSASLQARQHSGAATSMIAPRTDITRSVSAATWDSSQRALVSIPVRLRSVDGISSLEGSESSKRLNARTATLSSPSTSADQGKQIQESWQGNFPLAPKRTPLGAIGAGASSRFTGDDSPSSGACDSTDFHKASNDFHKAIQKLRAREADAYWMQRKYCGRSSSASTEAQAAQTTMAETHRPFTNVDRDRILKLEMQLDAIRGEVLEETREVMKEQAQLLSKDVHKIVDDLVARVRVDVQYLGNNCVEDMKKLSEDLQAEMETRARNDMDLHLRLACDSASLRTSIEEMRLVLQDDRTRERQAQTEQVMELRAIIDSVWNKLTAAKASSEPAKYQFVSLSGDNEPDQPRYKDCVGDSEDINTLYEMVQEVVGDSVMLKQELDAEKAKWAAWDTDAREWKLERVELARRCQRLQVAVEELQVEQSTRSPESGVLDSHTAARNSLREPALRH